MKHSLIYILFIGVLLVHSGYAHNSNQLSDLDISTKTKQQIRDGFLLRQSIKTFKQALRSAGGFATVGSDIDCDYRIGSTKIQDAIDLGETEIRVAMNDTYDSNIVIDDKNVIIKGGYSDCAAALADDQTSNTNIGNVASGRIITITGNSQRNTVVLDSLTIINGQGGIFADDANLQLHIFNSIIANNVASIGGGINIIGGDSDIELENTLIVSNESISREVEDHGSGGGIYCNGANSSIVMHGDSGIYGNKATYILTVVVPPNVVVFGGRGGGADISNGCSFMNYSGGSGGFLDFRGFIDNTATGHGGAIAVSNGSSATLFGHQVCVDGDCIGINSEPVNLLNNISGIGGEATETGGGAIFTSDATVVIYAGLVSGNESSFGAGAIDINSNSHFTTKRLMKNCWSQDNCNYYEGNKGKRGGVLNSNLSVAEISDAIIENNRADFGTVLFISNNGSSATVNNSVIHHNGNNGLNGYLDRYIAVVGEFNTHLTINHSTIVDNQVINALFLSDFTSSSSKFVSSIVHDSVPINADISLNDAFASECNIVHEDDSLTDQSFTAVVADPGFVDRTGKDYHIDPNTSLAVDYCFKNNTSQYDMDFDTRGYDDTTVDNNLGVFDIGADETIINDIIFFNGFEI
ncbi:MAG: hypothetical protein AB8B80_06600 [Marinicellaceae bacterium]